MVKWSLEVCTCSLAQDSPYSFGSKLGETKKEKGTDNCVSFAHKKFWHINRQINYQMLSFQNVQKRKCAKGVQYDQ